MDEALTKQTFTYKGTDLKVTRMGYGAMQLAGPRATGPPKDRAAAIAVLRKVVDSGVTHIDTSALYGPHTTNQVIKEALYPYPSNLVIVSKTAPKRTPTGVVGKFSRQELIDDVHDNLRDLGLDVLDVFNLRVGAPMCPPDFSIEAPLTVLAELQQQGVIRALGLSNVTTGQVDEARKVAPFVCVQNLYNLANRADEAMIDDLAKDDIAYVPYFPLRGLTPEQSSTLEEVAASVEATSSQVALAWLLARSPNMLVIPGTSSIAHLEENLRAGTIQLTPEAVAKLETISGMASSNP